MPSKMFVLSPSTDQRRGLAETIVNVLFDFLPPNDQAKLKDAFFTRSSTYKNSDGKLYSRSQSGSIQSFFKIHWTSLTKSRGWAVEPSEVEVQDEPEQIVSSTISTEEFERQKAWFKSNCAPLKCILEYTKSTFPLRREEIMKNKNEDYGEISVNWPRLFDIDGTNDFAIGFPLVADALLNKWSSVGPKLLAYAEQVHKSLVSIGINFSISEDQKYIAALFFLPYLIRSNTKKLTQLDSVKHFVDVGQVQTGIGKLAIEEANPAYPFVVCTGYLYTLDFLEFFVILGNKTVNCDSLIAAVDLAFKTYYILNISFPEACYGAWQFLDYSLFEMNQAKPVSASAKATAAFTSV